MPVYKNATVYIKPGLPDGGGGGWVWLIGAVLIFLGVMGVLNLLGFMTHDSFEYQPGLYRRCEVRSIFFVIERERKCTRWLPQGGKQRLDIQEPLLDDSAR